MDEFVCDPAWLEDRLGEVAILDVRGHVDTVEVEARLEQSEYVSSHDEYARGHIPTASFFSWTADAIDASTSVPAMLTWDADEFAATVEAKGVGTDVPVVVYDDGDMLLAPRIWWALRRFGHADVRVLDGGWARWEAGGRPFSFDEPCPLKAMAEFAAEPKPELVCRARDLLEPGTIIIDARAKNQFTGAVRRAARGGRVPGAVSLPRSALFEAGAEAGARLLSVEDTRSVLKDALGPERFAEATEGRARVVVYCNGGVASTSVILALARACGVTAANYDGSWNEWGNDDTLPIEC